MIINATNHYRCTNPNCLTTQVAIDEMMYPGEFQEEVSRFKALN